MINDITRRSVLGASAAVPVALGASASQAASTDWKRFEGERWTSSFLTFDDPAEEFRQKLRVQRSLNDEDTILHWYHFIMFAIPETGRPEPVVRWEGIELSAHRKIGDDIYRMHGHNLSFSRNLEDGEWATEVLNPISGRMVTPGSLALTEDPGYVKSPAGTVPLDAPNAPPRKTYSIMRREGNVIKVDHTRQPPASWPGKFIEMGYEAAPADLYDDPSQVWLPAEVSGAYIFPYPSWMEMGDEGGHMLGSWSGYKLRSVEELPEDFTARAEAEYPDLLSVDMTKFES